MFNSVISLLISLQLITFGDGENVLPSKAQYNETEAKLLLNIAAGAYSDIPEKCLKNTMPSDEHWRVYNWEKAICDVVASTCSSYIVYSDVVKQIIVAFRGTKSKRQLLMEGWQSLKPAEDFYGKGLVNHYFFHALNVTWPNIEPILRNQTYSSYSVTFTGHSLGGALASLAAAKTVLMDLRTGDQIKLITFGQPRVGNIRYARFHDQIIPYSFRLVHRTDIVPHLPACKKNTTDPAYDNQKSKPCSDADDTAPYHHGTEIWYWNGMAKNAEYYQCKVDEDFDCSDSLLFKSNYLRYIKDHRYYFDVRVPRFGKHGCSHSEDSTMNSNETDESDDEIDLDHPAPINQSVPSTEPPTSVIRSTISKLYDKLIHLFKR